MHAHGDTSRWFRVLVERESVAAISTNRVAELLRHGDLTLVPDMMSRPLISLGRDTFTKASNQQTGY